GTQSVQLKLMGNFTQSAWHLSRDATGGTTVVDPPTTHWINSSGGNWATASNWSQGVPTSTVDAVIDAAGTYAITISSADTAYSLTLNDAGATITDKQGG